MSVTIKYTESMHALLDWFRDQPCSCATIGHMNDEIEYSRETIRQNLQLLCAAEYVEVRHEPTGEYRLIEDPRDDELRGDGAGTIASTRTVDQSIDDVVQDWRPGNDLERREQRRAAGRAALEFLRDRKVAQAQEFKDEVEPDHPVDGQSPKTWWTQTARACLKQAEDAGLVWMDDTKDWHWATDLGQGE